MQNNNVRPVQNFCRISLFYNPSEFTIYVTYSVNMYTKYYLVNCAFVH